MTHAATISDGTGRLPPSVMVRTAALCVAGLILLSIVIGVAGRWFGHSISMAGHTDDTRLHEIVIGNDVIVAPANAIRFDHARRDGIAQRLDLYMRWPDLAGYSEAFRDDFNTIGSGRRIVFASFEPRLMSRDMSGRLDPIYRALIEKPGRRGPAGLTVFAFTAKSGYADEELVVGERHGQSPFVARCLTGARAEQSLAGCQRDIDVGDGLSLSYRFSETLLPEWRKLDASVTAKARSMMRTSRP